MEYYEDPKSREVKNPLDLVSVLSCSTCSTLSLVICLVAMISGSGSTLSFRHLSGANCGGQKVSTHLKMPVYPHIRARSIGKRLAASLM